VKTLSKKKKKSKRRDNRTPAPEQKQPYATGKKRAYVVIAQQNKGRRNRYYGELRGKGKFLVAGSYGSLLQNAGEGGGKKEYSNFGKMILQFGVIAAFRAKVQVVTCGLATERGGGGEAPCYCTGINPRDWGTQCKRRLGRVVLKGGVVQQVVVGFGAGPVKKVGGIEKSRTSASTHPHRATAVF